MVAKIDKFGLYEINYSYLEQISKIDKEVYFNNNYKHTPKPYLGILVYISDQNYFIPLTSFKLKHYKLPKKTNQQILIYEQIKIKECDLQKPNTQLHYLAVLDIKKMIPVAKGMFKLIDFEQISDLKYKSLLIKEFNFCKSQQDYIIKSALKNYLTQKNKNKVPLGFCDYQKLENFAKNYKKVH
ncbi:type III toxin-antitoxin system ToxN/AbiQ family toxin [Mycoplasmopsis ciconiae]|uniref:Type III toxin-antitoxin system ToxN/AbiQ family toxin n=1 Tax=Mycoplasmopsis ciconiae TaxID=561067 RepID=A0ABU7MLA8_9BACT|nr:type III toxin-antitoxin system ToxN/AbiQ family toxin [Mycoplasmopsis ciconiae]